MAAYGEGNYGETADQVIAIAAANHVPHTHTAYAASVTLGGEVYFWAAA